MDPNLVEKLSNQGLLGLFSAIVLVGFVYTAKKLLEEKEKRIFDAKEDTKMMTITLDKVEGTLGALKIAIEGKKHDKTD